MWTIDQSIRKGRYLMCRNIPFVLTVLCTLSLLAADGEVSASIDCVTLWGPEGVQISQINDDRYVQPVGNPNMISDGAGGAFYAWRGSQDDQIRHIYMQRIDASGLARWITNGIDINHRYITSSLISLTQDGSGGVIVCWYDEEDNYVYMQRLNENGVDQWDPGGAIAGVGTLFGDPYYRITMDGSGGAIMIYIRYIVVLNPEGPQPSYTEMNIQRVDEYGVPQWGNYGIRLSTSPDDTAHGYPGIISDGAGGAIYAYPSYSGRYIYIGRIDSDGTTLWSESVSQLLASGLADLRIVEDGSGGAIVSWMAYDNGVYKLRAQRFSADGMAMWAAEGEEVVTGTIKESSNQIAPDGSGGAILTWTDNRLSGIGNNGLNTYAQRLDGAGVAQWTSGGHAVCVTDWDQIDPCITASGDKGAIIAWADESGAESDIYAQRVDSLGVGEWVSCGKAVCSELYDQNYPLIVGDGADGAIVAWRDYRIAETYDYEIYSQRINIAGTEQWTAGGQIVCEYYENDQQNVAVASDGTEGAIVAWSAKMGGIYMQRVAPMGSLQWGDYGVTVCPQDWKSDHPQVIPNGTGGAIAVWQDRRNGRADIYAQQIDATGSKVWPADDVAICTTSGEQRYPKLADDGAGGAIVAWEDFRADDLDIFLQRVNAGGLIQWDLDGIGLCTAAGDQQQIQIISDGSDGAIVVWADGRNADSDIYMQRVDADGVALWTAGGIPVGSEMGDQIGPRILPDGFGGAIITWQDGRGENYDIYAQRIGADGSALWDAGGIVVCAAQADQIYPRLNSDGSGGAIITWMDGRALDDYDSEIYAQRIGGDGSIQWILDGSKLIDEYVRDTAAEVVPDGSGGAIVACYDYNITVQHVDSNGVCLWGIEGVTFSDIFKTGIPVVAPDGNGGALIAWNGYSYTNRYASSFGHRIRHRVEAYTTIASDPPGLDIVVAGEVYKSPYTFLSIAGMEIEIGVISPQFYQGDDLYFIEWSDGGDIMHVVTMLPDTMTYTAYFSDVTTDDEVGRTPLVNALHQNHPNPFNPRTTISFSLKSKNNISLVVYDVAGRLVNVLVDEVRDAGPHDVTWDGRDKTGRGVESGVYFYRLKAGEFIETRKMVLLR